LAAGCVTDLGPVGLSALCVCPEIRKDGARGEPLTRRSPILVVF